MRGSHGAMSSRSSGSRNLEDHGAGGLVTVRLRHGRGRHVREPPPRGAVGSNYRRCYVGRMSAKKISISVGVAQLAAARRVAKRDGISLSAVFVRGLERELEEDNRRAALVELVRDVPPVSPKRKRKIRASWERKTRAA